MLSSRYHLVSEKNKSRCIAAAFGLFGITPTRQNKIEPKQLCIGDMTSLDLISDIHIPQGVRFSAIIFLSWGDSNKLDSLPTSWDAIILRSYFSINLRDLQVENGVGKFNVIRILLYDQSVTRIVTSFLSETGTRFPFIRFPSTVIVFSPLRLM